MEPKIISIAGCSGSGKTTFLEKLIPALKGRGYKIGVLKHTHCGFSMDREGKDSWRHKKAGASATLVISPGAIALVKDWEDASIEDVIHYMGDMDLVIIEGFKHAEVPKIEIFRCGSGHASPLLLNDPNLKAFITDSKYSPDVPIFTMDDADGVADFIEEQILCDSYFHGKQV
ncbi:Molybdopterin-guanine dinucleotide biosynthesis protein B [Desulfamplus magnetovallimortis]|uniref:Molybdopterin-guanine dinucleotide biosynthesis protein B n=1 Tax=Desulfamplus magnetovallimortis TaxID=1246637 RepID=A0A1W1H784_9BACT|nr:molybdopterin-guanine dinucleotide biosynthesis protein B [Desulfamplus magnetovallimortis]SLM28323.1 Molybdopterin-guanine dinucleotide biosynthesis protein B [Desulfamplus magnetovallimortis]